MKPTILIASAFACLVAGAPTDAATYNFTFISATTPGGPILQGTGTLTFQEQTASQGLPTGNSVTYFAPESLTISIGGSNYNLFSSGYERVSYQPSGPIQSSILFRGGDNYISMGTLTAGVLTDADLSTSNVDKLAAFTSKSLFWTNQGANFGGQITSMQRVLAPVPEAGEWAMISAGALVAGAAARRQRRVASSA